MSKMPMLATKMAAGLSATISKDPAMATIKALASRAVAGLLKPKGMAPAT